METKPSMQLRVSTTSKPAASRRPLSASPGMKLAMLRGRYAASSPTRRFRLARRTSGGTIQRM